MPRTSVVEDPVTRRLVVEVPPDRARTVPDIPDSGTDGGTKTKFFDAEAMLSEFFAQNPERDQGLTSLVTSPTLTVVRGRFRPGFKAASHHHGVRQLTFVLKGELRLGSRVVTAGMGFFTPSKKYSFVAGPEGAEVLEIFDGVPARGVK